MDVGGGVQAQPGVAMFVVVPAEEGLAVPRAASIESNRSGKSGRYFRVLNCASLNGLSLETCGRRVRLGDAEVGEQERHRLGGHRGAAVGVDGQLIAADALLGDRSGGSAPRPARRIRGWRPSSRRRSGRRCPRSRTGSSSVHFAGPRSLVMSHDHTEFGSVGNQFRFHGGRVGGLPAPFPALAGLA